MGGSSGSEFFVPHTVLQFKVITTAPQMWMPFFPLRHPRAVYIVPIPPFFPSQQPAGFASSGSHAPLPFLMGPPSLRPGQRLPPFSAWDLLYHKRRGKTANFCQGERKAPHGTLPSLCLTYRPSCLVSKDAPRQLVKSWGGGTDCTTSGCRWRIAFFNIPRVL